MTIIHRWVDIQQSRDFVDDDGIQQEVDYVSSSFDAPWAADAAGVSVPTRYEVRGDTVVQVVDFTQAHAFPVVADPNWWQLSISAAVGVAVGTAAAIALKIPSWGVAIAGCITGGMNAMWDGKNFWGVAWNCLLYGAIGRMVSTIGILVTKFMAGRGVRV